MPILRFGVFEVDPDSGELRKRGFRIRLREQPLRLLLVLIDHAGRLVTREQLRHRLWPEGTFVDFDRAINKAASELRGALGDSASSPRFVETLAKRGYRFVCPVEGGPPTLRASTGDGFPSDTRRACLTGRYLWNRRTVTDLDASIGFFEQALEIDDGCALAHAGLADANVLFGIWGLRPPDVAFAAGRRAAARALELDPNLPEAHTATAEVLKDYEWDWCQAEWHFQRALVLRPDYATAHQWYAQLLISLRRYPEAASHIELARRADPVSPAINAFLPVHLSGLEGLRSGSTRGAPSREPGTVHSAGALVPRTRLSVLTPGRARRRGAGARRLLGRAGIHVARTTELRASTGWRSCWRIDAPFRTDRARAA